MNGYMNINIYNISIVSVGREIVYLYGFMKIMYVCTGLLKTLAENKSQPLKEGLKLFEISDVVFRDNLNEVGARNQRNLAAMYIGPTAGVEKIHGLVDRVMQLLNIGIEFHTYACKLTYIYI